MRTARTRTGSTVRTRGTRRLARPLATVAAAAAVLAAALPGAASAAAPTDAAQWDLNSARPSVNVAYSFESLIADSHLRYGERTWGINLVWSKTPHYEWRVEREADGDVSLYNTDVRDHLVYGRRGVGVNLRWLKDVRREAAQTAPGSLHDASVLLSAQPVIQGYVPFLGRYGGGVNFNAVLTKVANPPGGAPLFFVKPGYSTEQCGNASATTYLAPGASMTADQLRLLYGSATPSLRNEITFLACAVTQQRSAFVNVQWRQL